MEPDEDKTQDHQVLARGTAIGHYRIVEKIGAGGMGEVYLAEDTKLKRKVALKFMPVRYQDDADARARFMREAQAAAVLNHPNVVTVYEVGEYNGRPFIAMEHCPGRVLRDYRIGKTLTLEQILALIIQIVEGIQAAHAAGIVHRDLKPSNIVIDEFGKPKLLDFGLAAVRDADRLTKTGSTLGTIGYMSPEQVSGKDTDHRTDLFSLGVILYEMIALRRPFTGDNDAAVINSVLKDTPQPLARYCAEVPGELQRIVNKLLDKNKEFRYQGAADVLSDLRRLKDGATLPGVSTGLTSQQRLMFFGLPTLVVLILVVALSTRLYLPTTDEALPKKPMLAVLPFENLGSPEDEYFADGITDEIISRLAGLHGLGVISRTSTLQYKGTTKNIRDIGIELGADYILEGTIRWDKSGEQNRIRINPQLIQAADDVHLWTEGFDAVMTDIFAVQIDIAEQVAAALDVTLLGSEQEAITTSPTNNLEAYDFYLRGIQINDVTPEALHRKEEMFLKAIELDSNYALAHARLGYTYTEMFWFYIDRTANRLALAREAINKALSLVPDLPQAHLALGMYHYYGGLNYDQALRELNIAHQKQPNDSEILRVSGTIKRRQGNWNEGLADLREAARLDPRNAMAAYALGLTLMHLKQYREAESLLDRAITLDPESSLGYLYKANLYLYLRGDTAMARRTLNEAVSRIEKTAWLAHLEVTLDIMSGDFERALQSQIGPDGLPYTLMRDSSDYYVWRGRIYNHMGRHGLKRACYDSALAILEPKNVLNENDVFVHLYLAGAYAGLGRKEEAIRSAQRAVELLPVSKDAVDGPEMIYYLAEIYTQVGENDLAIDQLEYLLSIKSSYSMASLLIEPELKPLRDHPRFKALMEKYGGDHEI